MKFPTFLTNKTYIIIFLCIIIILLSLLIYLFDETNIAIQPHLNSVYSNSQELHKKYTKLLNENLEVKYENEVFIINQFLQPEFFNELKGKFNEKQFKSKDVYLRKGSGVNFFELHNNNEYFELLDLYYSSEITDLLTNIFKKNIQKPPLHDPNACSLLIYMNQGDHIDWHKDGSRYNGDRYVVLLTIVNENADKTGLSQNEFMYSYNGEEIPVKLQENSIIIFKGSEISHKSTAIGEKERRVLLSMTFCDICQEKKNLAVYLDEKIKHAVIYQ